MSQDMTDFEYIIIDDCSTDDSMNKIISVMSEWDDEQRDKVTIYRNRQNVGLPTSCNYVLGIARGRYIIRVDADDTLLPSAIQKMVWRIREDNTQGVISGYNYTDDKLTITETIGENRWHPGCSMLSRWCVNELKYKDGLKYLEGEEFFSRFKKQYKISFPNYKKKHTVGGTSRLLAF
jgi:glycosyltransferase involved in cell wall biosynthesis